MKRREVPHRNNSGSSQSFPQSYWESCENVDPWTKGSWPQGRMSMIQQSQEHTECTHSEDSGAWGQHEERVLRHSEHGTRRWTDKEYNGQKLKYPNGHCTDTRRLQQEQRTLWKNSNFFKKKLKWKLCATFKCFNLDFRSSEKFVSMGKCTLAFRWITVKILFSYHILDRVKEMNVKKRSQVLHRILHVREHMSSS